MIVTWFLFFYTCNIIHEATAAFGAQSSRVFVSTPTSKFPKHKVSDRMSSPTNVLTPDMSLDDTMSMLLNNHLSGSPVVDKEFKVIGIITSFDFLQKEAFEGALLPMEGSRANVEKYVEAARKICGQRVFDVMTHDPATVRCDNSMREAALIMTEHRMHQLPVVDEDGKLVGILTSSDVMRDLLHVVQMLPEAKDNSITDDGTPGPVP
jgi:predicted transcriptional regulator